MPRLIDLTGQRFGRLTALFRDPAKSKKPRWACACSCGQSAVVFSDALRSGHTRSCGCLKSEVTAARNVERADHGMTNTEEFRIWGGMLNRCQNSNDPNFPRYGGRGISVCPEWRYFKRFYADMGPRPSPEHSIDRWPDNDGDYEPGNVRWATRSQQARNRRPRTPAHAAA